MPRVSGLRWGLIGASDIAETRMLSAMRRVGDVPVGVYSRSQSRGAEFARRNGIEYSTTQLRELVRRADVDCVYVSSVNDQHEEQVSAAARAGKHILCEKPMSCDLASARRMVTACYHAGVRLAVNHHLPAAGTHKAIRQLVLEGAIGRPLAVNIRHATLLLERLRGWRLRGDVAGSGVILDLTCHDASVANAILGGSPQEVVAIAVQQGPWAAAHVDDACISVLRYPGNVIAHFHDSFTSPFTETYVEVHGDEGYVYAPGVMTPEPIGQVFLTDSSGTREVHVPDRRHTYDVTLVAFREAVLGRGSPIVDGKAGFAALAAAIAVETSAHTGARSEVQVL
jgi:1,5-anhydro-D-fructose reductase (1,5-anhydro-D-mannitol-forming)